MGINVAITPSALLLSILLLFLVAWTVIFAYLALKRPVESLVDTNTAASTAQPQPVTIAPAVPAQLPKMKPAVLQTAVAYSEQSAREPVLEQSLR
ncbi:hypothetical protein [Dictyobacter aurantiacus]|uniref:Uncharacterized protein n=1 Tax=Dictyobacter aurantiacus TaxID=1936993 RepID=A0A401ZAZ9_9CHLR|nr:hypothetical protein [Dictyobacter aurantiacus]GCE04057.1 hypothetical protein KDAU_13860 [Dictyobacter aurantiacus]